MLKTLYTAILDTLFPPRCPLCRTYVSRPDCCLCPDCLGRAVNRRIVRSNRQTSQLDQIHVVCNYRGGVQKLLHAVKYHHSFQYLSPLHFLLRQEVVVQQLLPIDFVVPVPLHVDKIRERGFNQTEKLFSPWAAECALPWMDALERTKATLPQYQLTLTQRRQNMQHAFRLKGEAGSLIEGKPILLVDDIFTTGATLEACARVLKKAGAERVLGLVLASDA